MKITIGSVLAGGCAFSVAHALPPLAGLCAGTVTAGLVLGLYARLFGLLELEDIKRLKILVDAFHPALNIRAQGAYAWLRQRASGTEEICSQTK